jgi:ferredoxin-NADP reductase
MANEYRALTPFPRSPVHENYVEIAPKSMENGCVSAFLNEQAKPGLAVEASGPYGEFYFDETLHKSIVLIAAGSGITPMISMLSNIDDLKLANPVTLLREVGRDLRPGK